MGAVRRCCRTTITVWFDAPTKTASVRGVDVDLTICEDMTLEQIVNEVLDELAYRWARSMGEVKKESVEAYKQSLAPYIEHYLASVLQNLVDIHEREYERCVEGVLAMFEDADGYYEMAKRRGIYVQVSVALQSCEQIKRCAEAFAGVLGGRRIEKLLPEDLFLLLAPAQRTVVEPIFTKLSPHEEILSFLQIRYGVRWWYTVFHSAHS